MTVFEQIAAIIDAAVAVEAPPLPDARPRARPQRNQTGGRRQAAAPIDPSPVPGDAADPPTAAGDVAGHPPDPPDVTNPPAAAPPPFSPSGDEMTPSSQTGAFSPESAPGGKGSAREAGARRARRGRAGNLEDRSALDIRLAYFPHTDLGNAERFRERNRHRLLWCAALGWLFWDGRRWCREGAEEQVQLAAHECVRAIQDEAEALAASENDAVAKVVNKGKADERTLMMSDILSAWGRDSESNGKLNRLADQAQAYLAVQPSQLDADRFKINCLNGTLIIDRFARDRDPISFVFHDPDDLITKLIPVEYDPNATSPIYDEFLEFVQPKAANRRFLHQWGGYSLTGDVSEQKLVFFWGKGKNGKSTLVDAWGLVSGDYGRTSPIESFLNEGRGRNAGAATPDLAMLKAIRFLRASEPEQNSKLAESLIKLITGGEPFAVRELNMPYFMLDPHFKLTMSGNYRPRIAGADEGIWRRVVLVPWLITVPEEKRDKNLGEKLRGEAAGILNRLLDGLRDWLDHGLVLPEDAVEATREYRRDSDPLGRFLDAAVVVEPGARVQSSTLHEVFNAWGKCNGAAEWSNKGLTAAMEERGFKRVHSNVMWWIDIKLTKTVSDYIDQATGRPHKVASGERDDGGDDGGSNDIMF
ncbi:phage/plasmid primase, P4 family [Xanthobacteraceae bacterium Astr-EGSB]|uniref:DNA primase family protein n=1 Tax=Astrobacterium formosum TaxID=3069710 RepID=UPI0027B43518|nr:phage/plasmid primase, P4 family [Xanthobacteraceae bacterium Astr-EGSB]